MKGFAYEVSEIVEQEQSIIYQKFTADDGSYFVILLI
tara:strand:+ start:4776 stop:4886 length:111 start_codon:yes stop_codon:yes gene_type:complete